MQKNALYSPHTVNRNCNNQTLTFGTCFPLDDFLNNFSQGILYFK